MSDLLEYGYAGLFAVAFLAATVFPAQSEILLSAMLLADGFDPVLLVAVATVGNTLGSVANWAIGRFLFHLRDRPWFPVRPAAYERASGWYRRFGVWSLLLAWAPFIGDPLTFVAGALRVGFLPFVLLVGLGKGARYVVLALATLGIAG